MVQGMEKTLFVAPKDIDFVEYAGQICSYVIHERVDIFHASKNITVIGLSQEGT
ncbi:MAG: hypothetical protein UW62_C0013G0007 [Candidatus Collierbacteria bacterium GW2011_GWB1_44_35]|uniref:Uncharacterized protein n=5 Tax=Candidatus Collieribacteriota TaxID=1752725 RepID=A0A0G1HJS9_9BACT|nr:MAG: hypothetical protein UW23_C0002G0023 [Candidatus Collierbacteria bacterium GW2011_GWA1_44_12]KKT39266.1 MAG: hypothetical protein UW26_C0005G0010 [Candidatus Collierbacteria bacterium GW2011_GWF1_44_12]KKT47180.1 MAG: hypothetical protein UW35_C0002G0009 [Candidatus Collierbacteria bacterium GW2011_GWF2_44_15]KKT67872.1 MAG: hypothetical protein UW62_C0013G0007 [Candidatus Collierbacteria bacterium GW2011_GWB1_44_35]KKT99448.1 MAG: hypothetical protein UW99_C0006G0021 [Candidatus Collie